MDLEQDILNSRVAVYEKTGQIVVEVTVLKKIVVFAVWDFEKKKPLKN